MFSMLRKNSDKHPEKKEAGFFSSITQGLKKTRESLSRGLGTLFLGKKVIDRDLLEAIETQLILADVGMEVTQAVIKELTRKVSRQELADPDALFSELKKELVAILKQNGQPSLQATQKPTVILVVGVNGAGKTTSIGKLAKYFQQSGQKTMLAAGDTFRAAAIEQLKIWGDRNQVTVVAQHNGADSASVVFDAYQAAIARDYDVLLADTAGRLHTQHHLMDELKKIKRVLAKIEASAPHEVLLILDATTGQNALRQAEQFHEAIGVTGVIITKLDGTAKGGIVFAIAQKTKLPIHFVGVGEKIEDLLPFQPEDFVQALFEGKTSE